MIVTEYGVWMEEGDEMRLTNIHMRCAKGVNPLAMLEFMGFKLRRSEQKVNKDE